MATIASRPADQRNGFIPLTGIEPVNGIELSIRTREIDDGFCEGGECIWEDTGETIRSGIVEEVAAVGEDSTILMATVHGCRADLGCPVLSSSVGILVDPSDIADATQVSPATEAILANSPPIAWRLPATGRVIWDGSLIGKERSSGLNLFGESRVSYDLADNGFDVRLHSIRPSGNDQLNRDPASYSGPTSISWTGLRLAGGTFHIAGHPAQRRTAPIDWQTHYQTPQEERVLNYVNLETLSRDSEQGHVSGSFHGRHIYSAYNLEKGWPPDPGLTASLWLPPPVRPFDENIYGVFLRDGIFGAFDARLTQRPVPEDVSPPDDDDPPPPEPEPESGRVLGLDITHVEMTDITSRIRTGGQEFLTDGGLIVIHSSRSEAVCSRVAPQCTISQIIADGTRYNIPEGDGYLRGKWDGSRIADWFILKQRRSWTSPPRPKAGIAFFNYLQAPTLRPGYASSGRRMFGGIGTHSMFFTDQMLMPSYSDWRRGTGPGVLTPHAIHNFAMGELHDGRPAYDGPNQPTGTAAWRGAMLGVEERSGTQLFGDSAIVYDFANNTVDVELSRVSPSGITQWFDGPYSGPSSFSWPGLTVNSDGSFYIPGYDNDRKGSPLHPTLGYVDGDFYGPNAEESAGVFERQGVSGAWLAVKEAAP